MSQNAIFDRRRKRRNRHKRAPRKLLCAVLLCGPVTELLLGGPSEVSPGRARLPPSRSQLSVFSCRCSPSTVVRAFLPGRLLPTQTCDAHTSARRSAIPWADNHSAMGTIAIVAELMLGGRSMGFSPCRPPRSPPAHRRTISLSCRVLPSSSERLCFPDT